MMDRHPRRCDLEAKEAELETIINLTTFMMTRCGRDLRYQFVSRAYASMLGRPPEEIAGRRIVDVMGDEGFRTIEPYVNRVLQGHAVTYERSVHFAGVGHRELSVTYTPEVDAAGEVVGWVASIVDNTEHKRAAEALSESEQRFQTLADGSPVLLWVNGPSGCEFVNRAYLDFLGVHADTEVRGYDWSRFVHPDDRDAYLDAYRRAFAAKAPFSSEFRFRRADGEWRWMRSEATARTGLTGFAGYVGATIDINELKAAEAGLREGDRRKDEFLAVLAHELRNPLAPIRTGLELLRVEGDRPGVLERVRPMMERQIAQMARLIDDLLEVARIKSGRIQLRRQLTSLSDLIANAVEGSRSGIEAAGLRLSVRLPDRPVLLDIDPTRLVQVLSNLLHNAENFTAAGGEILVSAELEVGESGPAIAIAVRDTGVGIAPDIVPHVFDLFTQGSRSTRDKGGLGIGLALARSLVEMQGGRLDVFSEGPGRGSTFTVRLPALETITRRDAPRSGVAHPRLSRRVLIIDDNADAAEMLAALVTALGGEAETALDGEGALHRAAALRPEVILLDIGLPGMDGYETCRRLRKEPSGQFALIVAVTGWGQERDKELAAHSGFDMHLTKPVDPAVLERLLAELETPSQTDLG